MVLLYSSIETDPHKSGVLLLLFVILHLMRSRLSISRGAKFVGGVLKPKQVVSEHDDGLVDEYTSKR